ncbi:MAG: XdhC family protein, partial [Ignavibacteriaceae bacterium]|nr:XdhC family protein [Ignavibacteriaceae bacterium]
VKSDGTSIGTVGGGAIEEEVIEEGIGRIHSGENGTKEYLLSNKKESVKGDVTVVPMSCSGRVTVFYEVHGKLPNVYVFGGGHVGHALLYHLKPLNFFTVLVDNRDEFANKGANPNASQIILSKYDDYSKNFNPPDDSFFVILTHGHAYDYIIAKNIYLKEREFPYVGAIASKSKAASIVRKLKEELGEDINLSKFYSPVGLKIGGSTAEEIALGIAAEIQSVYYQHLKKVE